MYCTEQQNKLIILKICFIISYKLLLSVKHHHLLKYKAVWESEHNIELWDNMVNLEFHTWSLSKI